MVDHLLELPAERGVELRPRISRFGRAPARAFLDAEGVRYEVLPSDNALQTEDIATRARQFTLRIECLK